MILRRLARAVSLFALLPLGVVMLALASCQGRLIYHPQRYAEVMRQRLPPDVVQLAFSNGQGQQVAFYAPPAQGGEAQRLWLVCGGNGQTALGWLDWVREQPDPQAGWLLVDYPGYGFCAGSPTPARVGANVDGAVAALQRHLGLDDRQLAARLGVFGHSLGCAAALMYTARHDVRRIALAAPFTSMAEMANHALFWPMGWLVWHRYDNRARLAETIARQPAPIDLWHGTFDSVIPLAMGQALAEAHPSRITFHPVNGADHDDIAADALRAAVQARP